MIILKELAEDYGVNAKFPPAIETAELWILPNILG